MIIISPNVRGLGKPEKGRAVRKLVKNHKADCLILQETKVASDVDTIIGEVWGNHEYAWNWILLIGTSGGLISVWNEEVLAVGDEHKGC